MADLYTILSKRKDYIAAKYTVVSPHKWYFDDARPFIYFLGDTAFVHRNMLFNTVEYPTYLTDGKPRDDNQQGSLDINRYYSTKTSVPLPEGSFNMICSYLPRECPIKSKITIEYIECDQQFYMYKEFAFYIEYDYSNAHEMWRINMIMKDNAEQDEKDYHLEDDLRKEAADIYFKTHVRSHIPMLQLFPPLAPHLMKKLLAHTVLSMDLIAHIIHFVGAAFSPDDALKSLVQST